jgi:hypothetical protein
MLLLGADKNNQRLSQPYNKQGRPRLLIIKYTINLPKTSSEWRVASSSEVIQMSKRMKIEDRPAEELNTAMRYPLKLHVGEKAISVHLRDLSGWNSASEIQKSHYLGPDVLSLGR